MESALLELQTAARVAGEMANLQFQSQGQIAFSVRMATPKDMKWIEERKYSRTTERSIPGILEEIGRLVRLYNLSEYESMIQNLALQYKNLSDQISFYKEQIGRFEGEGKEQYIAQKKDRLLQSFCEEESMIRAEIASFQQSIGTYRSKIDALVQEETKLTEELKSMENVITQYEELMKQNQKLQEAVDKETAELEELTRQRRRTYDNLLTPEEAAELDRRRGELDKSEREEAELMVELDNLLKETESSLSLSTVGRGNEINDLQAELAKIENRRGILRHICEEFVFGAKKDGSEVAVAMEIIFRHGGEVLLEDLKSEMVKELQSNSSVVLPTIYSLVGNQIIRIDRSTGKQKVICMI